MPNTVLVIRKQIDWEFPAWGTFTNLLHNIPDQIVTDLGRPGTDAWIERNFRGMMHCVCRTLKTIYANPLCVVEAEEPSDQFYSEARHAFHQWRTTFRQMTQWSSSEYQRQQKQAGTIIRQLQFLGVLVINGKHIHPGNWPEAMKTTPPRRSLVGQKFGLLSVESWLGQRRWLCRCACDNITTVREQHLLSGATKSCGCVGTQGRFKLPLAELNRQKGGKETNTKAIRPLAGGIQMRPIIATE